jgi:hypothetical protein
VIGSSAEAQAEFPEKEAEAEQLVIERVDIESVPSSTQVPVITISNFLLSSEEQAS